MTAMYIQIGLDWIYREDGMAKTLIDIDPESLAAAARELGTSTKKDTVNMALREVTAMGARRRDVARLMGGDLADLANADVVRDAWRS
jgi:Arc/MetJ family transcription regulator